MLIDVVVDLDDRAVARLGDVYVKVDVDPDRVARETAALQAAAVPVPELVWQRPGAPSLLALAVVTGSPLADDRTRTPHPRSAWVAAGAVARRLHDTAAPPALRTPSRYRTEQPEALERWLVEHGVGDRALIADHARRAHAAAADAVEATFVHGDLQPSHVFVDDAAVVTGVIDWGDAGLGDRHHDLAVLTLDHPDLLDAVLEGYGADVDLDRIAGCWSWRRLGAVRWLLEHGFDPQHELAALAST